MAGALVLTAHLKSRDTLRQMMDHKGFSCRGLADAASIVGARDRTRVRVHSSTIGNLLGASQDAVRPERAKAIEKALDLPVGALFEVRVSSVSLSNGRRVST